MRLASVPSTATRGFCAQRAALDALAALAAAAGHASSDALHSAYMPALFSELMRDGNAYPSWHAQSTEWHLMQESARPEPPAQPCALSGGPILTFS